MLTATIAREQREKQQSEGSPSRSSVQRTFQPNHLVTVKVDVSQSEQHVYILGRHLSNTCVEQRYLVCQR